MERTIQNLNNDHYVLSMAYLLIIFTPFLIDLIHLNFSLGNYGSFQTRRNVFLALSLKQMQNNFQIFWGA